MSSLIIFIIFIAVAFSFINFLTEKAKSSNKPDLSVYEKKPFLFDAVSELNLYKMLLELYGNEYRIFTQVNYSHLIEPRKNFSWAEKQKYRSRIDRKSADFVLCDKEKVVPQLIIELDGYVHNFKSKQARDEFINDLTNIVDLPILHIKTTDLNRDFVKSEIDKKLNLLA